MLVLSRQIGEEIVIRVGATEIVVKLVDIRGGNKCRLGVTAPDEVQIHRREVADMVDRKNTAEGK